MTSALYTKLVATAQRLLADKGQSMVLHQTPATSYTPSSSQSTLGTPADTTCVGVILDYNDKAFAAIANADSSLVQRGDRKIILGAGVAFPSSPEPGNTITVASEVWSVVNVKALNPGGVAVIYTLQVRK